MSRLALHACLLAALVVAASVPAQGVKPEYSGASSGSDSAARFAADLTAGRLVLRGISFNAGGATIDSSSIETLRTLAVALQRTTGTYLIESHTASGRSAQALSDRRAAAVRTWLLAAGVDPSRLYAAGFGATRPRAPPNSGRAQQSSERIEVSRVS